MWRFITLLLAALGLVMGGAHVLELPPKMQYDAEMYAAVTSTLYRYFGLVGGPLQIASVFAALVLSYLVRGRSSFRLTLFGTLGLALSLALWFSLVAPVNAEWLRVIESAPNSVPTAYQQLRPRWEYGHVAAFIAWFFGFSLLLFSVLKETPAARSHNHAA
jgi:predicted small integral membrane protein